MRTPPVLLVDQREPAGAREGVLPGVRLPGGHLGPRPDRLLAPGTLLLRQASSWGPVSWEDHLACFGPVPRASLSTLAQRAEDAGLRGFGGAGFPTARKLRGSEDRRPPLVVVNAAEGEQASAKDGVLLRHVPHLVLDGALAAADALGADQVTVRLAEDRPDLPGVVLAARSARGPQRQIRVSVGPTAFTTGEASAVVNGVLGRAPLPSRLGRPPRVPATLRHRARPALVLNAETCARLALVARGLPSHSALLTVGGGVATPGVVELASDRTVRDALAAAGGPRGPLGGLVFGGWHGRWTAPSPAATGAELNRAGIEQAGGRWGAGVLVAVPASLCPVAVVGAVAATLAEGSAGQCGPCRSGLPQLAARLGDPNAPPEPAVIAEELRSLEGRGICAHPTASAQALRSALQWAQEDVDAHRAGRCTATGWPA